MYINIEKVLILAEITLPHKAEKIQKIQKSYYFPFVYRDYIFEYSATDCTWGVYKWEKPETFNRSEDIEQAWRIARETTEIIEEFFESIRSMKQKSK